VKDLAQDVAEDVLGAAKDGSDLAQDVAEDVLGSAKNGSVKVLIVKVLFFPIVKARAKPLRRCTTRAKQNLWSFNLELGNLEPQDAQGWSRAHPARPTRTASSLPRQAPFERLKPAVGAVGPVAVAVDT